MKFDFSFLGSSYDDIIGLDEELENALRGFTEKKQGFLDVLDVSVKNILTFAEQKRDQYEMIVVLGIGGSALGARMLADYFDSEKLIVLDTLDPYAVERLLKSIPLPKTLWVVVSKSGKTIETMTLRNMFQKAVPAENWVVISEKDSDLWEWAEEIGCPAFAMPENVGGRFSVLTAASLLPAALVGFPIEKLLAGAKKMREKVLSPKGETNEAWQLASVIHSFGRSQIVQWFYCDGLKSFGAWWVQLVAESLAKEAQSLTPICAMGPTDQHSLLQLVTEGEDQFLNLFVKDSSIERSPLGLLMNTELRATAQSITELGRPTCVLDIKNRNADTLGQLIVLWEMVVAFLGELRDINAFDQPGVERGKALTREFLKES